jgi:hypothetical protein
MSICLKDKDEIVARTAVIKELLAKASCAIKSCSLNISGGCNYKIGISHINILNCPKGYNKL